MSKLVIDIGGSRFDIGHWQRPVRHGRTVGMDRGVARQTNTLAIEVGRARFAIALVDSSGERESRSAGVAGFQWEGVGLLMDARSASVEELLAK